MNKVELLSPAGDMEGLISAVQNGANAVYFGAEQFNARVNGKNFGKEELVNAIEYAKLRGVKTHLTLNILIKNNEFEEALELVEFAYEAGIDAIIVQDLGLAKKIIDNFPDLEVHSSTQMTVYNLDGVKEIEKLGFSRCVLARELSIEEIENICKNTSIDIEVFIHGALCICYSGQCLMSSMIGGRSGNRGKCAGTCRLPYSLLRDDKEIENGYLLSSKDVCALDLIPRLINAGVKSFKIEGRMKSKEYVGIVTSIYRKYIDLANSGKEYKVEEKDKEALMQIFNRGGFSTGYLNGKLGKEMMYIEKPNHIGTLLGEVLSYNPNKGHVKIKLRNKIDLGDSISINNSSCKVSELMIESANIKQANKGQIVTIGRIQGKIFKNDKVYKTVSEKLNSTIHQIISKENIKRPINAKIYLKKDAKIKIELEDIWSNKSISLEEETIVKKADNSGISKERIIEQLSKTGNTVFKMEKIEVIMDENIILPISSLNSIRRDALEQLENKITESFKRNIKYSYKINREQKSKEKKDIKVTVLFNNLKENINYEKLEKIDNVYIPFKEFINNKKIVAKICNKFNTYLMLPNITKSNYEKLIEDKLDSVLKENVKGVVISNISHLNLLKDYKKEIIANYTLNIANDETIKELKKLGISKIIVSPEADKNEIQTLDCDITKEVIAYGRTLLMTTEYCLIGTYKNCKSPCIDGTYKLKDRMGFEFPIYIDRINCNNQIYNSKITSILWADLNIDSIRIDILEETENEIQDIINIHKDGGRLEGENYTNGNLNREI